MAPARLLLLTQLASTLPLVGLIWLIQVVSYPLFAKVGAAEFPAYHAARSVARYEPGSRGSTAA